MDDSELLAEFVEEARDHLSNVEMQLLEIEVHGANINDDLVNTVFRAIHSVKGAAGFLGLTQINNVAHRLENILGRVRDHQLIPDPYNVDVMLKAADRLSKLIEDIDHSNETDNAALCEKLDELLDADARPATAPSKPSTRVSSPSTAETVDSRDAATGARDMLKAADVGVLAAQDSVPISPDAPVKTQKPVVSTPPNATAETKSHHTSSPEASIRVGVRVLDRLMNLAGELVLSRNQLLRVLSQPTPDRGNLDSIAGGLDQVTTELQETIMQTRMQPIGNVFNKFPRVVRDLASSLGKQIDLQLEGVEVETDKTIVEAIADPLTHLVRNSCDHGIEVPAVREAAGKPAAGTVLLRAFHQAGKVMIEIRDDGAGMDADVLRNKAVEKGVLTAEAASQMSDRDVVNLIFAPGFSTAKEVTAVSGRGVGMDVVRTNIEQIGGSVEVESELGRGSVIRITLPLTLAIVPSMIVSIEDRRYALPQTNILELVQTDGKAKRIDRVGNAEVLHLRGSLIPLVRLRDILGLESAVDPEAAGDESSGNQLVVVESGRLRFALVVDRVLDSEEIVVKPLGRHLANLPLLAGSTILGDGRVAMILDASGIASGVQLANDPESMRTEEAGDPDDAPLSDINRLVLMSVSSSDHFALPMDIVSRIERVPATNIDVLGDQKFLKYRGGTLPLIAIEDVVRVSEVEQPEHVHVVVYKVYGHEAGLIAPYLNDIRDCQLNMTSDRGRGPGVAAITVIDGKSTRLLDLYGLTEIARPDWFESKADLAYDHEPQLLVCEDSAFFRNFLIRILEEEGYRVTSCEDGEEGWIALTQSPGKFDLLVTDVEMPELDGIELTRRIRKHEQLRDLPVIALTSLADDESTKRGIEAGVDDYQIKMNKPDLLASIHSNLQKVLTQ